MIFDNVADKDQQAAEQSAKRISLDCKATVQLGNLSRGGLTRGCRQADDHDMGIKDSYVPCGIVDEDTGELFISFGSSYKTSDFIVDTLQAWWSKLTPQRQHQIPLLQIKVDNGPENSGVRTQFLKRMVDWADQIRIPIQLLYYPPYHSKYNPIERCWGALAQHWNGTMLVDLPTMLVWAMTMKWKGAHPSVNLNPVRYERGISLSKEQMEAVEARLERHHTLPKWDILIQPS